MDDFGATVDQWHDVFTILGTAAVTLLGLLFVAMSLRDDIRDLSDNQYLKRMTSQNLTSFVTVFLMSVFFMIPDASADGIAISIIATITAPLVNSLRSIGLYWRELPTDRGLFVWYGVVQPLCYLAALVAAILLGRYEESALSAMLTVMIFLLLIPTNNAWQLTASRHRDAPRSGS
ncbi:MAG: hypothetical protein WBA46_13740 [Thermomicrobiales bacterium]